ncbi:MAG: TAXI family TRAP transporter solute-binding subunit [Xanthobacteraceae bacterium]
MGRYTRNRVILASVVALAIGLFSFNLAAQVIPRSIQEGGTDAALREKKNAWTVGIAGGLLSGTYMRFVDEMASVLNDGDNLRILPIVSYGAASNLDDLLYLRGVDAAVTQSDVFEYFRTQRKTPNLEHRVQYVIRLPISELHILARNDVQSLEDLRGKKVNFGPAGTGASLTGTIVFQRLGINVDQVMIDQPTALQKLQSGQVDAIARVIPKPIDFFGKIPQNSGLHLVNIPFTKKFEDLYTLGEFTKQDYPNLLQGQDRIDTIAVPAVLAVFNWQKNTDRYNRVERFIEYLFSRWDTLQHPPYHPKWRDVNLAATVPGWTRFSAAEQLLQQMQAQQQQQMQAQQQQQKQQQRAAFETFLSNQPKMPVSDADREDLFRKFLQWQAQEQHR